MKTLKNYLATLTLIVVMTAGTTLANTGIVVVGLSETPQEPCIESSETKVDWGIVVVGLTQTVVQGLTGIVVVGAIDTSQTNCGIVVVG